MTRHIDSFYSQCLARWTHQGLVDRPEWAEFETRLQAEFGRLASLLWDLYGGRPDFAFQIDTLVAEVFAQYAARPGFLKERDRMLPPESAWFLSGKQVGAVAYVDHLCESFRKLPERLPYLKELGISYLHLMPFFLVPQTENDGGYAVSSYRETNPDLGTMAELEAAARLFLDEGIVLVADFIFNHTSNEHEWAKRALAGDLEHQDFYLMFSTQAETIEFQRHLRDIFPEHRKGSFTYCPSTGKWVWTSFNSYQWDLNYANPAVFRAMASEMLSIANRGIAILRLDAVAFIWKQAGTSCENLPQAHLIIQAFQAITRLACPSLLFKSEAIVHPDEIYKYIDARECQLSYNPLLMAELWEAAATKDSRLLQLSLRKRHRLPHGCAWINYVRCHDDIGWTFADEDAAELGINGYDHRKFLNDFYLDNFPGSFATGVSFQYNPENGDRRICGTTASLAGLEKATSSGLAEHEETALRRIQLFYGLAFSAGGIPLIYLGDELAMLNDYSYEHDPHRLADSRWVHRSPWQETLYQQRTDSSTHAGRVFQMMKTLSAVRRSHAVFSEQHLTVLETEHKALLAFNKQANGQVLTVIANFAEEPVALGADWLQRVLDGHSCRNLLDNKLILPDGELLLEPCQIVWLMLE